LRLVGKQSPIAAYRLKSALARLHYESHRARELLGWQPRVGVREGIRRVATGSPPPAKPAEPERQSGAL
jgi:nucleoside-diphosphate-sugar epimerase